MIMLILYTEYAGTLRLLGIYTDTHSLERRFNFVPMERPYSLEVVEEYFSSNPIFFGKTIKTDVAIPQGMSLAEFGKRLFNAVNSTSREDKILLELTTKHSNKGENSGS